MFVNKDRNLSKFFCYQISTLCWENNPLQNINSVSIHPFISMLCCMLDSLEKLANLELGNLHCCGVNHYYLFDYLMNRYRHWNT